MGTIIIIFVLSLPVNKLFSCPVSHGPSRVTLIRGESCSLVDIPTYLSSSVELGTLSTPPVKFVFTSHRPRYIQIDTELCNHNKYFLGDVVFYSINMPIWIKTAF